MLSVVSSLCGEPHDLSILRPGGAVKTPRGTCRGPRYQFLGIEKQPQENGTRGYAAARIRDSRIFTGQAPGRGSPSRSLSVSPLFLYTGQVRVLPLLVFPRTCRLK